MAKKRLPIATNSHEVSETSKEEMMEHKAKYALEDIERAEMHKKDKELMKLVKKAAKEKVKCLSKI
jgi:hypothetical protein